MRATGNISDYKPIGTVVFRKKPQSRAIYYTTAAGWDEDDLLKSAFYWLKSEDMVLYEKIRKMVDDKKIIIDYYWD